MINRFIFNIDITISDGSFKEHEYVLLETHDNGVPRKTNYAALYFKKIISLVEDGDKKQNTVAIEKENIGNEKHKDKKGGNK